MKAKIALIALTDAQFDEIYQAIKKYDSDRLAIAALLDKRIAEVNEPNDLAYLRMMRKTVSKARWEK